MSSHEPAVEATDLRKSYREGEREHEVLCGAAFQVGKGERVAVLGPSGSGKSTLLNLLSGIDLPDRGTVRIAGVELTGLSERDRTLFRRRHLGFVFQFFNLLPTLTVLENLLLPIELNGRVGPEEAGRARELLGEVGLEDRAEAFPDRLSGGEQQRVAIARALVHRPSLLLADEPTGNLDEDTGARVVGLLEDMVAREGSTLMMVTHSRELASRMDRVLRVGHGVVTEESTP
jgi:putative ABC transport system ATP-binding protein